eukprot:COSAG01_NODE_313_length_19043_cov_3.917177_1_plen_206_part_00
MGRTSLFNLIAHLSMNKTLKSEAIKQAFVEIDRAYFIPHHLQSQAYMDQPLAIGEGQTISQPTTVAIMLEALDVKVGQRVLDIGSGSGWSAALVAYLVGESGQVTGLERHEKLLIQSRLNIRKWHMPQLCLYLAHDRLGMPESSFDRILVSAAAPSFPGQLLNQLNPNGILVIPIQNDILICKKDSHGNVTQQSLSGFRFVPLLY